MLTGDLNAGISDSHMDSFDAIYLLKGFIVKDVCYKNPNNPTCIDFSTNCLKQFQATLMLEIGLSDIGKMTLAAFKSKISHPNPKGILYQNYQPFDKKKFEKEIINSRNAPTISHESFLAFKTLSLKL